METEIAGWDDEGLGVEVIDNNGDRHQISLDWDGNVTNHAQETYPRDSTKRTDEQERLMQQVRVRAEYAAHNHFEDKGIIEDPSWLPAEIERAMNAVRTLPTDTFVEHFRDYYDAVRDHKGERIDDDVQSVDRVRKLIYLNDDDEFVDSTPPKVQYRDTAGETHVTNLHAVGPEDADGFVVTLPPLTFERDEFEFPDSFQALVVSNLMCQIRDIYLNMGEEPPAEYQVKGMGKTTTLHEGLVKRFDE
ncbi:hypothetical protein [Halorubellus sp. PRR65]|uniref:hypothetical protein n=1 Tax=Halorubellus sp. PRR65 TaxID=3098148 RepID=UPI002B25AE77|nr:hypothetical protein [Halorubellus sp. PRR65]